MGICDLFLIKYGIFRGYICFLLILLIVNLWMFFNWVIVFLVWFFGGVINLSNDFEKFVVIDLWVSVVFNVFGCGVCDNLLLFFICSVLCLMFCFICLREDKNLGDLSVFRCLLK